jgi:toxin-antitoxin system PIN domain toxin
VKSLDTNILYFATNIRCPEHSKALRLVEEIAEDPRSWIIADQVLFEYYRLIRNPTVLANPLSASEAARRLRFFREEIGCLHCAFEPGFFRLLLGWLEDSSFAAARTFDAVLAVTLKNHGVKTFFTRNTRDFAAFGWFDVVDPVS